MKIRVATYNIHKGISSIGSRPRVHALKQAISTLDADVFFLQEVQGRHDLYAAKHARHWPEQTQYDFLAGDSHQAAYGMNAMYDHGHHGNALLSRFPIASSMNRDVSDHAYESRGILHCVLGIEGVEMHCYVVHLGLFAGSRMRQTDLLIEAVSSTAPSDAPVIIAGDFNDWGQRLSGSLRNRLGVTEVFDQCAAPKGLVGTFNRLSGRTQKIRHARTFPSMLPCLSLDRIYVRGFSIETAQVMHGVTWSRLSDHAPIITTLQLQK